MCILIPSIIQNGQESDSILSYFSRKQPSNYHISPTNCITTAKTSSQESIESGASILLFYIFFLTYITS